MAAVPVVAASSALVPDSPVAQHLSLIQQVHRQFLDEQHRLHQQQRHLQQLMGQLRPLADRWELRLEEVEKENGRVVGDAMLTAAFTILGCRLPPRLRRNLTFSVSVS